MFQPFNYNKKNCTREAVLWEKLSQIWLEVQVILSTFIEKDSGVVY